MRAFLIVKRKIIPSVIIMMNIGRKEKMMMVLRNTNKITPLVMIREKQKKKKKKKKKTFSTYRAKLSYYTEDLYYI